MRSRGPLIPATRTSVTGLSTNTFYYYRRRAYNRRWHQPQFERH